MKSPRKMAFIIVVLLQVLLLLGMVFKRVHLLKTGKVVRLGCRPVDPRSLLSGDYVELTYIAADLPRVRNKIVGTDIKARSAVYVAVEKKKDSDTWDAVAYSMERKKVEGPDRVILRGRVKRRNGRVRFGVEQYFVPQFQGLRIEREIAKVTVDVAVSDDGECAIKRLYIAGKEVTFY